MLNKNLIIGLAILAILTGGYYYFRQYRQNAPSPLAENLPVSEEEEIALESQVGVQIPENVEKIRLTDVSGGEAEGIATRKYEEGKFEHSVIASLPEPEEGKFYQGWLAKEDELLSTGKMEENKGGWMLIYTSDKDQGDYRQAIVTLEEKEDDQPEEKILEGEF